jgi:hypothetical protein
MTSFKRLPDSEAKPAFDLLRKYFPSADEHPLPGSWVAELSSLEPIQLQYVIAMLAERGVRQLFEVEPPAEIAAENRKRIAFREAAKAILDARIAREQVEAHERNTTALQESSERQDRMNKHMFRIEMYALAFAVVTIVLEVLQTWRGW